MTKFCEMKK